MPQLAMVELAEGWLDIHVYISLKGKAIHGSPSMKGYYAWNRR